MALAGNCQLRARKSLFTALITGFYFTDSPSTFSFTVYWWNIGDVSVSVTGNS